MTMPDYTAITPDARYLKLAEMAPEVYGPQWKGKFSEEYGLTAQTLSSWANKGAPVWACVAIHNATKARDLDKMREILNPAKTQVQHAGKKSWLET